MQRVLRSSAATLDHTFYPSGSETGTDSTTTVTVAITDANGTAVASGNATSAGQGRYTFPLSAQASLALLTVAWSGTIAGAEVIERDEAEIVGGQFFTLAEGRNSDVALRDPGKYTTEDLVTALLETEQECEEICDRSFFPRYQRAVMDGTGTSQLMLTGSDIRSVRSVSVAPRIGQTFTPFSVGELAALAVTPDRVLQRTDYGTFTAGRSNVVVEFEYGLDSVPSDLKRAALIRFRSRLIAAKAKSGVPDRALSYTTPDGTAYRLSQPGPWKTGIPDVDAIYGRYSLRDQGSVDGADSRPVAASRTLNYDPQRNSLFHGGVR